SKLAPTPLITQRPGGSAFARRVGMPVSSVVVIAALVVLAVTWWQHRPTGQITNGLVQANSTSVTKPAAAAPAATLEPALPVSGNEVIREAPSSPKPEILMPHNVAPEIVESAPKKNTTARTAARIVPAQTLAAIPVGSVPSSQLIHVKFVVNQASWIEVYDAAGKRLYYALAPAGDNLNLSGDGPLQVFLGYSPGVSIEMNGALFNQAPFTHSDNTARFRLGAPAGNEGNTG
ncbi:MAG: DUF4115 domain-containing protein, partial [Gammaproteobacteria bacterium]